MILLFRIVRFWAMFKENSKKKWENWEIMPRNRGLELNPAVIDQRVAV